MLFITINKKNIATHFLMSGFIALFSQTATALEDFTLDAVVEVPSQTAEASNVETLMPLETVVKPAESKNKQNATSKQDEKIEKEIQKTIAGSQAADKLDPDEKKAPVWPMNIPKIPVKFDWVLLKKGELLGGDLSAMYQDRVEFDSDEVGVVSIKMKDILQIRTKSVMSVRFVNNRVLYGKLLITEDKVTFIDYPDKIFNRADILTISPAEIEGQSQWDGELSLGLNFSSGNSPRFDYLFSFAARRLDSAGRMTISYKGIYSEVENTDTGEDVKTEESHRFIYNYDFYYSKKMFFRIPNFELYTDHFKNLEVQATLGFALGYEVIDTKIWDNKDIEMNLYTGPSVQFTRFVDVEPGEESENTSPVLTFGGDFDLDLTQNMEFFFVYDGKLVNEASGRLISHMEVGIEIEILDDFDVEIATIIDHTSKPTANESGELPEKTDTLFVVSLEYNF
ncbi:MAG: DUF481 domain-containing protein [Psychromonas sp.]